MIDVHVHLAALPDGDNGCHISKEMVHGALFRFLFWKLGISVDEAKKSNERYVEKLVKLLRESKHVRKAVLLGMDGVYDDAGNLNKDATHFIVSNDYVLQTAKKYPDLFLAGISVNPKRKDAVDEINRCAPQGAALVKVLPNSQDFDPANKKYLSFYKAMAKHKLPLLSHVGYEFSLWGKDQSVGDPARVRMALDEGVTVIAAHGASYGLFFYEKYWNTLLELTRKYPNFYWDASALTLQNRVGMLLKIRNHPELHSRMVFGTDYPLPCYAYPALLAGKLSGYIELLRTSNPFDRHHRLLEILGIRGNSELLKDKL